MELTEESAKAIASLSWPQFRRFIRQIGLDINQFTENATPAARNARLEEQLDAYANGRTENQMQKVVTDGLRAILSVPSDGSLRVATVAQATSNADVGLRNMIDSVPANELRNTFGLQGGLVKALNSQIQFLRSCKGAHDALQKLLSKEPILIATAVKVAVPRNRNPEGAALELAHILRECLNDAKTVVVGVSILPNIRINGRPILSEVDAEKMKRSASSILASLVALGRNCRDTGLNMTLRQLNVDEGLIQNFNILINEPQNLLKVSFCQPVREMPNHLQTTIRDIVKNLPFTELRDAIGRLQFPGQIETLNALETLSYVIHRLEEFHNAWQGVDINARAIRKELESSRPSIEILRLMFGLHLRPSLERILERGVREEWTSDLKIRLEHCILQMDANPSCSIRELRSVYAELYACMFENFKRADERLLQASDELGRLSSVLNLLAIEVN